VNPITYDESLVVSTGLSFFEGSSMSQFQEKHEDVARQDGRSLGTGESQATHGGHDPIQKGEASQRNRWLRFLARQIARDILRAKSAKEGGNR
jgi:hypothetical protein